MSITQRVVKNSTNKYKWCRLTSTNEVGTKFNSQLRYILMKYM
jgi:hypothetical protein